jgi:exonuclease SbcD
MRFAHTADWHLGRLFHQTSLTDDQSYVLDRMIDVIRDASIDAVLIAGDLYDRAVPPPEAVALLDDVLCRIAIGLSLPVVMIAGNHDSPQRLSFGSRLLEMGRVHVFAQPCAEVGSVAFHDNHGTVRVHAVPYAEPAVARQCFGDDSIDCHDSAMRRFVQAIAPSRVKGPRTGGIRDILLAHAFVTGGAECESERPLSVGGAGTIDASCFAGFDYVALGHLHEPQTIGNKRVSYSGSLLKYSFSECEHSKSISIVEMDGAGKCIVERVPLKPRRDVRRMTGMLAQLLKGPPDGTSREDYIEAVVEDDGALLDPMSKLRQVYSNLLSLVRPRFAHAFEAGAAGGRVDLRAVSEDVLFGRFFEQVTGAKPTEEQAAVFCQAVSSLRLMEREVAA